jgi:hypothetical protein
MPETNKPEDRELIPAEIRGVDGSGTEAKPEPETDLVADTVPQPQSALDTAGENASKDGLLPGDSNNEEIDEFAQSVMFELERAGLDSLESLEILDEAAGLDDPKPEDLTSEAPVPAEAAEAEQSAQAESYETFFAGWDGPEEEVLEEDEKQQPAADEEPLSSHHSLSEISLAASPASAADENAAELDQDVSIKHDALADAVQSALLSIYGDSPVQGARPQTEPRAPFSPVSHESEWSAPEAPAPSLDDGLSPQDVILNYFSYTSGLASTGGARSTPVNDYDEADSSPAELGARFDSLSRPQAYSRHPAAARPYVPHEEPARYPVATPSPEADNRTSLPVPAQQTRGNTNPGKENGRLLGAAAIGLIGGIAIAATLAVFVISSYTPQSQTGSAQLKQDGKRVDAADPAYGNPPVASVAAVASPGAIKQPVEAQGEIDANDTVAQAGQPAPLSIKVKAGRSLDQTLVSITGVPNGARLNSGVDAGDGNWLLPLRRLSGLTINLPPDAPAIVPLEVQLVDSNVRTPLSGKKKFAIRSVVMEANAAGSTRTTAAPVTAFSTQTMPSSTVTPMPNAVPPQPPQPQTSFKTQTVPAVEASLSTQQSAVAPASLATASIPKPADARPRNPVQQAEIEDLIREGNKRMREGDIVEARQFYQRAVDMGDAEAALAMGRSYDPIYFARIDKKNAEPDAAKAFDWYRKAMDNGATQTAKVRIENLKHFLNE